MGYQAVNEIEKFTFEDCVVSNFLVSPAGITLTLEALMVDSDNSQNTNYTQSYADTTIARLLGGKIVKAVKDGYKYYDANDVLIKEIPDESLDESAINEIIKKSEGAYLYYMEKVDTDEKMYVYNIGLEFVDESDNTIGDSYQITVSFEKAIFTWERYLNKVQR